MTADTMDNDRTEMFDIIGSASERDAAYDLIHGAPASSYHDAAMCFYHPCAKCKARQADREREMEEASAGYAMIDEGIRERRARRERYQ